MSKIKLTKGELKRQRDALAQFERYLPTLQLKKQQLQIKTLEARRRLQQLEERLRTDEQEILEWAGVMGDPETGKTDEQGRLILDLARYVLPQDVRLGQINIAGAYVPVLQDVSFPAEDYDLYATPWWVDRAIEQLRALMRLVVEGQVIKEEIRLLERELRVTSQRVNLFEKVKIPEAQDNIRKITIYIGDQQANAVGVSKVAKRKLIAYEVEPVTL